MRKAHVVQNAQILTINQLKRAIMPWKNTVLVQCAFNKVDLGSKSRVTCLSNGKDLEQACFFQDETPWPPFNLLFFPGCYSSICEDGVLKIIIQNATLTCNKPGQVIEVALNNDKWLHEGSVVCPACSLFCDDCSGENGIEDLEVNDKLKEELDNSRCLARSGTNLIVGFLQSMGFDKDLFSKK